MDNQDNENKLNNLPEDINSIDNTVGQVPSKEINEEVHSEVSSEIVNEGISNKEPDIIDESVKEQGEAAVSEPVAEVSGSKKDTGTIIKVIVGVVAALLVFAVIGGLGYFGVQRISDNSRLTSSEIRANRSKKKSKDDSDSDKDKDKDADKDKDKDKDKDDAKATATPTPTPIPEPEYPENAVEWTVIVYMCGSNLESEAGIGSYFLNEMAKMENSDDVNVIVETGGSYVWQNKTSTYANTPVSKVDISPDKLCRFKIEQDKISALGNVDLDSMGKPETLTDFINYSVEKFPAKNYMLVVWDHGYVEPYGSLEHDELFYTDNSGKVININDLNPKNVSEYKNDNLTLPEFEKALADSGVHFELIGFNTCLSASVEIASACAPYANYMVASEESVPAVIGLPVEYISYLSEHPEYDGLSIGKEICSVYSDKIEYYTSMLNEDRQEMFTKGTMSVIDLSCMEEFQTLYGDVMKQVFLSCYDSKKYAGFQNYAIRCECYGSEGNMQGNTIDLKSFLSKSKALLSDTDSDERLIELIENNIFYVNGSARFESYGISFYFPNINYVQGIKNMYISQLDLYGMDYTEEDIDNICRLYITDSFSGYCENIKNMDGYYWYAAYLGHRFGNYFSTPNEVQALVDQNIDPSYIDMPKVDITAEQISYEIDFDETGAVKLDITQGRDSVVSVEANIVYFQYTGYRFYTFMGSEILDLEEGSSHLEYTFNNEWIQFNGQDVCAFVVEITENYVTYAMPAMVNDEWCFIFFQHDLETDTYTILYAIKGDSFDGLATNEMFTLADGDMVQPLYYSEVFENSKTKLNNYIRGIIDPFEYNSETCTISKGQLFNSLDDTDSCILVNFIIKDAYGNKYYTDSAAIYYNENMEVTDVTDDSLFNDYGDMYSALNGG